ncbi:hypothetical protein ANME2D_02906 [Candidatus Methanoperedens nitroreducens]|uniref:Intracellular proteinase inhibitor BsuPI domain-containing protein n=1 Tax=Candidatus Methanoperedens nitratireducens TaxID=1392998 RepID=A0A062V670_9EURY|nr:hypothetical protein [Candidatus Methanoperedens nitroreducens]KCZ70880.1 hypothetical protein ANME2D_02906 [Candidatus Methanoperedens nitroreducens]MDJ1421752.1 hypothetical protein [Candidatus Methanoperedens sp.]
MKRQYILSGGIILLTVFFLLVLFKTSIPYGFLARSQTGELNLTIIPEKTQVEEGENFKIHLILSNADSKSINLWMLEEQVSYDILFSYQDGAKVSYNCGIIQRFPLTNENLITLQPGDSITATQDSSCWNLTKGAYTLSAVYHTGPAKDERITNPYWLGTVKSSNITIFVE